jgi:hypothetical protein
MTFQSAAGHELDINRIPYGHIINRSPAGWAERCEARPQGVQATLSGACLRVTLPTNTTTLYAEL